MLCSAREPYSSPLGTQIMLMHLWDTRTRCGCDYWAALLRLCSTAPITPLRLTTPVPCSGGQTDVWTLNDWGNDFEACDSGTYEVVGLRACNHAVSACLPVRMPGLS